MGVLARRGELASWQQVAVLPDGPVSMWMAVLSTDGRLMGAAPIPGPPAWCWQGGRLAIAYGKVTVRVTSPGWYETCCIIAVSSRQWVPVVRIGLGKPKQMRAGEYIHILDGKIAWIGLAEAGV